MILGCSSKAGGEKTSRKRENTGGPWVRGAGPAQQFRSGPLTNNKKRGEGKKKGRKDQKNPSQSVGRRDTKKCRQSETSSW